MKIIKPYISSLLFFFLNNLTQNQVYTQPIGSYNWGSGGPSRIRVYKKLVLSDGIQYNSYKTLNLKNIIKIKSVTTSPITIEASDFNTICRPGNTWLTFISGNNLNVTIS